MIEVDRVADAREPLDECCRRLADAMSRTFAARCRVRALIALLFASVGASLHRTAAHRRRRRPTISPRSSRCIKQKADVNAAEADGTTALHWAARADNVEMARTLLRAGADAKKANRYGVTALQLAAVNGSAPIIKALIEAGADVNAVLPEGETVLMTAARTGRAEVLAALLDAGAKLDAREKWYGETALHLGGGREPCRRRPPAADARRRRRRALGHRRPIAGAPASRSCRSAAGRR